MKRWTLRRRVALVSEHASPLAVLGGVDAGGQNVHVAALAQHLARRGHRVEVFTRRDDPALPPRARLCPGVTVVHVDAGPATEIPKDELLPYMGAFGDELLKAWTASPPDIVHAHFWMSGLASFEAGRQLGLPGVQTFHALGVVKRRHQGAKDTSPPARDSIETLLLREVDHTIATCSDEVFELARLGGDRDRITVVPCGVDLDQFCPEGPAEERPRNRHRLVVVSRMVERKGIGNVITAMADLPGVELIVAGGPSRSSLASDPEARRFADLVRAHGVGDRVDLRGGIARDAVAPLMRSADVVVCAPWYEPFGIVPLEAMACGRPVVATAVGGLIDTVVDGVTGVHVPPRRPDRLAGAIQELLDDPERRRAMGQAGARRARERYGWGRVADATVACYERVIARQPAALTGSARQ